VTTDPRTLLKSQQREWAAGVGVEIDTTGYCLSCDANFFEPLSACARRDLAKGDGSELGKPGQRGKIQALHSSAALAVNVFDYWRGHDLRALGQSFGLASRICGLTFEHKFPTGLGGIAPNLDVVLSQCDGSVLAIESKFTEPFAKAKSKNFLKQKYFPNDRGLWRHKGLSGCQTSAEDLRDDRVRFEFLDAAQLLKHMLGPASGDHPWKLCCLWYDAGGPESARHSEELALFSERLGPDSVKFTSMTYQALFVRLSDLLREAEEHKEYLTYLRARYFVGSEPNK